MIKLLVAIYRMMKIILTNLLNPVIRALTKLGKIIKAEMK